MANTSVSYVDLDFDTLKTNLKTYLKGNKVFKDYDFEGSNLNVLLDLLSYNTHKNAFYINMLMSEAFLDSAQLTSSVVSHAKELNYLPASYRSAKAKVTVTFEATGDTQPYVIEKGSLLSTVVKSNAYTFTIPETLTVSSSTRNAANTGYVFTFTSDIYEGYYIKDTYVMMESDDVQRFKITNKNVDVDSITVAVYQDGSVLPDIYKQTQTLLGLKSTSKVYFIQSTGSGYYEILFGDGVLGTLPKVGSQIVIDYRLSSGSPANGAKTFSMDFDPTAAGEMLTYTVETVEASGGGAESQQIDLVRQYAPRYFATQQRAVSTDDYASLILSKYSGSVNDVTIYGGETLEPKLYGRVVIALKPVTGDAVPTYVKDQISNYLLDYVSLPTRVVIVDPNTFHCEVVTTVQYDPILTTKTATLIKDIVFNQILDYSSTNLDRFDRDFRYSKFVKDIDDADEAIVSNDTEIRMIKKLYPTVNRYYTTEINFGNQLHPPRGTTALTTPVVISSLFTYIDDQNVYYPYSFLQDDGFGTMIVRTTINNQVVTINSSIGTVDHQTGTVKLSKLLVSTYGNHLSLYASTRIKDIVINKSSIIKIDAEDITVNVIGILQ
jgi:hypothetical protein